MHALPGPIVAPFSEVAPHRRPRRKLMREGAPLAAGAIHIEDGIEHFAHVGRARMPTGLGRRNERFQDLPFSLTQIAWIASSLHRSTSSLFPFGGSFSSFTPPLFYHLAPCLAEPHTRPIG